MNLARDIPLAPPLPVKLPKPRQAGGKALLDTIRGRKSARAFGSDAATRTSHIALIYVNPSSR